MTQRIPIEVAYATAAEQVIIKLEVEVGTTALQALEQSGIILRFPEIDPASSKLGIFGKLIKPDAALRAQDRVEIYRPLIADPKEVRRQRAAEGKVMKKGGGE